jgi:hypothetical protein
MTKVLLRLLLTLLILGLDSAGGLVLLFGTTSLGWRAHGAPIFDLTFLHLDWVWQPDLPYWSAHMRNLMVALAGLLLIATGSVVVFQLALGRVLRMLPPVRLILPSLITLLVFCLASTGSFVLADSLMSSPNTAGLALGMMFDAAGGIAVWSLLRSE